MKKLFILTGSLALLLTACGQSNNENTNTNGETVTGSKGGDNGKTLFTDNCAQCHGVNTDKTGPKLAGVLNRWNNDTARVLQFVKNSQLAIGADQNGYAGKLFHNWNEAMMPAFPNLSDNDIKDIVRYVNAGKE